MSARVLIVGAGPMAIEYAKVLAAQGVAPLVVGRGADSAARFHAATGVAAATGGLDAWLGASKDIPDAAIVATGERWIGRAALALLAHGVRRLLLEKPGGYDADEVRAVHAQAMRRNAEVWVGYNRRFLASVAAARDMIAEDGGVASFAFEFTEWSHVIGTLQKEEGVKEQWFLHNSTHVIDLAFHLGGRPRSLCAYRAGGLEWHPAGSIFAGAGITQAGALFSYQANWEAPGRWAVEALTRRRRLVFKPLEKLLVQRIGSVAMEEAPIDDRLDREYKPGLYRQVCAFLAGDGRLLVSVQEQVEMLDAYARILEGR